MCQMKLKVAKDDSPIQLLVKRDELHFKLVALYLKKKRQTNNGIRCISSLACGSYIFFFVAHIKQYAKDREYTPKLWHRK